MSLLLMGGEMRAQGHAQALVDIFDLGANLQMATDIARFHHSQVSNQLTLEPELNATVGSALAAMGHQLTPPSSGRVGGYQAIYIERPAAPGTLPIYRAGSDHRKDGAAVGW